MVADSVVLWFSVVVFVLVALWAVWLILGTKGSDLIKTGEGW